MQNKLFKYSRNLDNKFNLFKRLSVLINKTFKFSPLLYGSAGLEFILQTDLKSEDIDILVPSIYLNERWEESVSFHQEYGYELVNKYCFKKDNVEYQYDSLESLQSYYSIDIDKVYDSGCIKLLSLSQYLKMYEKQSNEVNRSEQKRNKDKIKIELIKEKIKEILPLEEMGEFFKNRIESYDEHMINNVEGCKEAYLKIPEILAKNPTHILDLGCGTGLELEGIFKKYPNVKVTCIDLSQDMLNQLKRKYKDRNIEIICGNYFDIDLGNNKYDVVLSVESFHHFNYFEREKLYHKIFDSMKDEGQYIEADYIVSSIEQEEYNYLNKEILLNELEIDSLSLVHYDIPLSIFSIHHLLHISNFRIIKSQHLKGSTWLFTAKVYKKVSDEILKGPKISEIIEKLDECDEFAFCFNDAFDENPIPYSHLEDYHFDPIIKYLKKYENTYKHYDYGSNVMATYYYFEFNEITRKWLENIGLLYYPIIFENLNFYKNGKIVFYSVTHEEYHFFL